MAFYLSQNIPAFYFTHLLCFCIGAFLMAFLIGGHNK